MAQIQLLNILWLRDSPYGTFSDGDSVDIYWDTDTSSFIVNKNSIAIVSGNNIPITFRFNNLAEWNYKTERVFQATVCSGTSLLRFERIPSFPYMYSVEMQNHPTCSLTGEVCDLAFDTLPVVTDASSETASDGGFVISASGSNGAVKYKLNADFEYNDGTGQVSGTFTGLAKGNYLVFCRDAINCISVMSVTVGVSKTYGVLYQHEFYSIKTKKHQKTELLQKDYAGAVTEVNCEPEPVSYLMGNQSERDKFVPLKTAEMSFRLTSLTDGQFQTLYTNDPEKFRLKHYIDSGSGYSPVWTAKVLPSQYSEAYIAAPYDVIVTAHDGLATLQDIDFLDDDGNRLQGSYKQIALIAWILGKIGLGLNIRSSCNIFAVESSDLLTPSPGMTTTASSDPLDQAYVDVLRYYLISETPSCWDVLNWLLEPYGAQIILYNNVWNILRVEERVNSFNYREFNSVGAYVSNSSYNPVKDMKGSGQFGRLVWTEQGQNLNIHPGFGQIRLLYNLGRKKNILENGDFSIKKYSVYRAPVIIGGFFGSSSPGGIVQGTIADINGFEIVNDGNTVVTGIESLGNGNVALKVSIDNPGGYLLTDTYNLKVGNADSLKVTVNFKVIKKRPTGFTAFALPRYVKLKIKITYGSYFLRDDGSWSNTDTEITYFVKTEDLGKYLNYDIVTNSPDATYISGQNFNIKVYFAHGADAEFTSKTVLKAKPTITLGAGYRTEYKTTEFSGSFTGIYYYELKNDTNAQDGFYIIRPDDYNAATNPYQWIMVAGGPDSESGYTYSTFFDKAVVEPYSNEKQLPDTASYTQDMENENKTILDRTIYHGSIVKQGQTTFDYGVQETQSPAGGADNSWLWNSSSFEINLGVGSTFNGFISFSANAADLLYTGYLRNATGGGYVNWQRSNHAESKTLEGIYMDMYSAQYNKPWQQIQGPFMADILFTPLDVMRETMNGNRKYFPSTLTIDYKSDSYNAEFMELTSVADADIDLDNPAEDGHGFSTGFSLGFDS